MRYVIFSDHPRYHLTTESGQTTLCGIATLKSEVFDAAPHQTMQITDSRPSDRYTLCRECEAIGLWLIAHKKLQ